MFKRLCFSYLVSGKTGFGSTAHFKIPHYFKNVDSIKKRHKKYADFCGAEYKFVTDGEQFESFFLMMTSKYPFLRDFDVISNFKPYLINEFLKDYDEVLYLDVDIFPGYIQKNFFQSFNLDDGVALCFRQPKWINEINEDKLKINPIFRKWFVSKTMAEQNGFSPHSDIVNYNTGVVGATKTSFNRLNYFENLDVLKMINETDFGLIQNTEKKKKHFFSCEVMFQYCDLRGNNLFTDIGDKWNCFKDYDCGQYFIHASSKEMYARATNTNYSH